MPSLPPHRRPSPLARVALALLMLATVGCAGARGPASALEAPAAPTADAPKRCARDADCVVKDIGNCCGYYPACVHREQPVDPEGVQRRCREQGLSSICGFPEITACTCVDGTCRAGESSL